MITTLLRSVVALALLLVVAGCAGGQTATWTYSPAPSPSPTEAASPSASASAPAVASPSAVASAPASVAPSGAPSAAPSGAGEARVIELEETGALQITMGGQQVKEIPVTVGETILFRVTNSAGFDHNLYIGTPEELQVPNATTPVGVPTNQNGTHEFTWVVPENAAELQFACTVPGHYSLMNGTFTIAG